MLVAALLAAVLCAATLPVLVPFLRRHSLIDEPGVRSSHSVPTPRGGGLAVVLAICLAPLVTDRSPTTLVVVVAVAGAALLGLTEDLHGVPIRQRLAAQALVAAGLVSLVVVDAPTPWLFAGSVVLVVLAIAVINAVNFMDGINGISAATGVVAGSSYAVVGAYTDELPLTVLGACVATACAAFAPWNVPFARVFLGDVGSYGLGAALAGCLLVSVAAGVPPEAAVAPLALYLADTGTVLVGRIRRRQPLGEPHRLHAYQRLTDTGLSHVAVSTVVLLCTVTVSALGLASLEGPVALRLVADAAAVGVIVGYLVSPDLRRGRVSA